MIPFCVDQGVGIIPWSPLARGFLTAPRRREDYGDSLRAKTDTYAHRLYYADSDFAVAHRIREVSTRLGIPAAQIALAWLMAKPGVTAPIVGFSKVTQMDDAIASVDVRLSAEDIGLLEEPYTPHPVLGLF